MASAEPWRARGWADRVDVLTATGPGPPAAALLVRPDGYVAWATGDPRRTATAGLHAALTRWFGRPLPGPR